jgi:NADH-quinone oxidoreductase subunit E
MTQTSPPTATTSSQGTGTSKKSLLSPEDRAQAALNRLTGPRRDSFLELLGEYPNKRSMLMMVLRLVEEEFSCVTDEAMQVAADLTEMPVAHVQGMVTFYTHFKRSFHGKHRFMVCATLMCALDGNTDAALKVIQDKLGLKAGEKTFDALFSCEKVECLADCDRPPVVQKDSEHFCRMKGEQFAAYVDSLLQKEGKSEADYRGKPGVFMDTRVEVIPPHYTFAGERDNGARHFDDKDPYFKAGQGESVTALPRALHTPFSSPVADSGLKPLDPHTAAANGKAEK